MGLVRWWLALPACVAGVLSSDTVLYGMGRYWRERVLQWRMVRLVLNLEREERLKMAYGQHAVKTIVAVRHVMGLRAAAFLTAGIVQVPFSTFLLADGAAALVGVPLAFGLAPLLRVEGSTAGPPDGILAKDRQPRHDVTI